MVEALDQHYAFLADGKHGLEKEVQRCRHRIRELWKDLAMERVLPDLLAESELQSAAEKMARREAEPYSLVEALAERLRNG